VALDGATAHNAVLHRTRQHGERARTRVRAFGRVDLDGSLGEADGRELLADRDQQRAARGETRSDT